MRVRVARFKSRVRTGPESHHHQDFLNVADEQMMVGVRPPEPRDVTATCEGYLVGTIDAYYQKGPEGDLPGGESGEHYLIIRSPKTDRQTGEPLVNVISMQNVADCEALSPAMAETIYGKDAQWQFRPEPSAARVAAPIPARADGKRVMA